MTTGPINLEERIGEIDRQLDEIQEVLNISHNLIDVSEHLNKTPEDIRQLKPQECEEIAILLGEYAITLKSKINKMVAKRNWLQSNIQWMGRTENAQKLTKLKVGLGLQIDSMYGLSEQIGALAKYYNDLGKTKKWK